jgi:outer membrane protein assembly factor BamB
MFGEYPSKIVNYLASVDAATGDTLWEKQIDYASVYPAKQVSLVGNFIIDNKSGKELFKLSSSTPISISGVREDGGCLYLKTNGNELIAIDLQKGEVIWKVKGDFNKFFIDETRIYTSNQSSIEKKTGKLIWANNSDVWLVGIIGDYLIGYLHGEDDPEIFVYNKNTGKLAGYLWSDNNFCTSCLGNEFCNPEFIFAEQGEGNKTAALIKCSDGVYLYTFEVVKN